MSDEITIVTNNVPRLVVDAYELTEKERKEFDYINWGAVERGEQSPTFVRYKGEMYHLEDVESTYTIETFRARGWDGYISESFFSGKLFRFCEDHDYIVMGRYYS